MSLFLLAMTALLVPGFSAEAGAARKSLYPLESIFLEGNVPELEGHVVLVDFWASWCGPCAKSFPALDALYKEYRERGVTILGVSVDEKKSAMKTFLKRIPVTFPIVRDARHMLVAEVNVETMPTSILLDRAGHIRYRHKGFHGDKTIRELREHIESLLEEK